MVYVEECNKYRIGERMHYAYTLHQMTAKELRGAIEGCDSETTYKPVHFTYAHKFVKRGGHHTTPLYIDGNAIRYAKG